MLKNYQLALMKPYFDAGLKTLAQSAGYPLPAIQNCSQFKRTHHFILEVWEATYRSMLSIYMSHESSGKQLIQRISHVLQDISNHTSDFTKSLASMLAEVHTTTTDFTHFHRFLKKMGSEDETWKFWVQFVLEDGLAYVGLFLAIRGGDWQLRMTSMKLMAPIFTAFDHATYCRVISQHVADILCMPPHNYYTDNV